MSGKALLGLLIRKARIGGSQQDIGNQAVIAPLPAVHDHKCTFLHCLGRHGQACVQVGFEPAADDISDGFVIIYSVSHPSFPPYNWTSISAMAPRTFINKG